MIIAMDAVELILDRAFKLNVVTDAVAATVALGLTSIRSRILLGLGSLNDQLAGAVGKLDLLVLVTSDDVVAIFHPLDVRLWCSTNAALQCQNIVMQIVAL